MSEKTAVDKPKPKKVGISLRMFTDKTTGDYLYDVAREATFCENALWDLWRMRDPVTYLDIQAMNAEREATGKWPKLPKYSLKDAAEGKTPHFIGKNLCPNLTGHVTAGVVNQVRKLYGKLRWKILWNTQRMPKASDPRIRFRERAIRIERHVWTDKEGREQRGFAVRCRFLRSGDAVIPISTRRMNKHHLAWLEHWAGVKAGPCGGMVMTKTVRGKKRWFIALARERADGEIRRVLDPVEGRCCYVYAPLPESGSEAALVMRVQPTPNGRPWREEIEAHDLVRVRLRWREKNEQQGRNFHQSRERSAASGHGEKRRMRSKKPDARRYGNQCQAWIENRSRAIVDFAINTRCCEVLMEDLVARDSRTMRIGEFPYYQFMLRTQQKAEEAGLKFRKIANLDGVFSALGVELSGVAADEV